MGRSKLSKGRVDPYNDSDAESVSSTSTAMSDLTVANETEYINSQDFQLEKYVDALYEKRGSTREAALAGLVDAFEAQVLLSFVDKQFITLLHQYINSIKKGSIKEACLASHAIGLLAITVGAGNNAHEIMEESVFQLSQSLISGFDTQKSATILDCIALVTFIGANDLAETETSLKVIWQVIYPKLGPNVAPVKKPPPPLLATAISAWAFLLTTTSAWGVDPESLKEPISYLSTLLDDNERSVRIAAGEAIGVFFELGLFDVSKGKEKESNSADEKHNKLKLFMSSMKAKIIDRAYNLSAEAGGKGIDKKNLNDQRDMFQNILDFVQTGECPQILSKISSKVGFLRTSTWIEMIQVNFFKRYLRKGFLKHAQDNELLHEIFYFVQDKRVRQSTREVKIARSGDERERTQKLKKERQLAQQRKGGHLMHQDD